MRHLAPLNVLFGGPAARLRRPGRTHLLAAASLATACLLSACGGGSGSASAASTSASGSSASAAKTLSMTVGGFDIPAASPIFYAAANGYFDKVGLNLDLKTITAAEFVPAVTSGQVDASFGSVSAAILAAGQNLPVRYLFQQLETTPGNCPLTLTVLPGSPIKSIKDLKGKTIAIDSQNSNEELSLNPILNKNGIQLSDVKYLPVGAQGQPKLATLQKGTADAMVQTEPFSTSMVASGSARLITNLCVAPAPNPLNSSGYFTSASYLSAHKEEIKRFEQAMTNVSKFIKDNKSTYDQWLASRYHSTPEQVAAQHTGTFGVFDNLSSFTYLKNAMVQVGLPVSQVDVKKVYTPLMVAGTGN